MSTRGRVIAGVEITDDLIAQLLADQAPSYADCEVGQYYVTVDSHVTVRLDDDFAIRFPRKGYDEGHFAESVAWLRRHSRQWEYQHQIPLFVGEPGRGFPYPWEVIPWLEGANAVRAPLSHMGRKDLAHALREIHQPATPDAPLHPATAAHISTGDSLFRQSLRDLHELPAPSHVNVDLNALEHLWDAGCETTVDTPPAWTHGSLDPRFVISEDGHLRGVINWRTYGPGDPARDLGCAAMLMPAGDFGGFVNNYDPDTSAKTVCRARAFLLLCAVTHAQSDDGQLSSLAWRRLAELTA